MKLADFSIKNQAASWMIIFVILVGGLLSYKKVGRLEDPEFTVKEAVIITSYPGANVHEVETELTERIETAVQQMKQLHEVRSTSRPGLSIVHAEMKDKYNKQSLPQVWDELRRKIHDVKEDLPSGAREPTIIDDYGDVFGEFYALTGDGYTSRQLEEIAKDIRRELLLCEQVGRVEFYGVQREVVYLEMDRASLASLGLAPVLISQTLYNQHAVTDGGIVQVGPEQWRIEIGGTFKNFKDIEEMLINDPKSGTKVRLKDIAHLKKGYYEPATQLMYYNGNSGIGIGVSTVAGGNVLVMGKAVDTKLEEIRQMLPVGVEINAIADQAKSVSTAVDGFVTNLIEAIIIVFVVLVLFMGFRQGLIIGGVLLLTILSTFIWMDMFGIVLQRISLGALIIALGMLVDNAIVVVEGISTNLLRGKSRYDAAVTAVKETQWPLLGATIIAILAFAAISLSNDSTGEYLKSLFQVIGISLGMSWVLAVTVTPFLCTLYLKPKDGGSEQMALYDGKFFKGYRSLLAKAIKYRWFTVGTIVGLLFLSVYCFRFVDQNFFANSSRPQFIVSVFFPEGTHINATRDEMLEIEKEVSELEGVTNISTFVGSGSLRFMLIYAPEMLNAAYGQLLVSVDDYREIPRLMDEIRQYLNKNKPSATHLIEPFRLGTPGASIEARIVGPDIDVLYDVADKCTNIFRNNPNIESIRTDWGNRVKKLNIELSEARSRDSGVSRTDIANALQMNRTGLIGGAYRDGDHLLPVIFRLPEDERVSMDEIGDLQVWSSVYHKYLPLGQVTDSINVEWDVNAIEHLNRKRTLTVSAKQITGNTAPLFAKIRPLIEAVPLPEGSHLEWGGEYETQTEANEKLGANIPTAMFGMLFISVLLFKTFRHPFIIFAGLPLALIGVVSGLLIFQQPFGFMALLGFLSLSGMLIKNEIVLLEQINLEKEKGKSSYEAILDAAVSRVRPVSMAALTTVLGMIPLIWDPFFGAMSVTIMGGLTFATVLTLIFVPVLYSLVYRVMKKSK